MPLVNHRTRKRNDGGTYPSKRRSNHAPKPETLTCFLEAREDIKSIKDKLVQLEKAQSKPRSSVIQLRASEDHGLPFGGSLAFPKYRGFRFGVESIVY